MATDAKQPALGTPVAPESAARRHTKSTTEVLGIVPCIYCGRGGRAYTTESGDTFCSRCCLYVTGQTAVELSERRSGIAERGRRAPAAMRRKLRLAEAALSAAPRRHLERSERAEFVGGVR